MSCRYVGRVFLGAINTTSSHSPLCSLHLSWYILTHGSVYRAYERNPRLLSNIQQWYYIYNGQATPSMQLAIVCCAGVFEVAERKRWGTNWCSTLHIVPEEQIDKSCSNDKKSPWLPNCRTSLWAIQFSRTASSCRSNTESGDPGAEKWSKIWQ